jgi:hypothetical protein
VSAGLVHLCAGAHWLRRIIASESGDGTGIAAVGHPLSSQLPA